MVHHCEIWAFLQLSDEQDDAMFEGELFLSPPATGRHQPLLVASDSDVVHDRTVPVQSQYKIFKIKF